MVKGENIFFTFSTATEFDSEVGYSPYGVYSVIEHSGDFSASAKSLLSQGYGATPDNVKAPQPSAEVVGDLLASVRSNRFSIHKEYKELEATLTLSTGGKEYKIAGPGMILGVLGKKKSGKTVLNTCINASALSDKSFLGLKYQSQGKRKLYFDTEQSDYWFAKTQERIYQMASIYDDPSTYEAYNLRKYNWKERVQIIDEIIKGEPVELITIDGLVDICQDMMESRRAIETLERVMNWTTTGALIVTNLHETKSMGFARGHLGTELENKYDHGLTVEKDQYEANFKFKCRDSRFAPHPVVDFTRDERGWPILLDDDMEPELEPAFPEPEPEPNYNPSIAPPPKTNDDDDIPF